MVAVQMQLPSCMLCLGHSKLNVDGRYNQICQCISTKTELNIFF